MSEHDEARSLRLEAIGYAAARSLLEHIKRSGADEATQRRAVLVAVQTLFCGIVRGPEDAECDKTEMREFAVHLAECRAAGKPNRWDEFVGVESFLDASPSLCLRDDCERVATYALAVQLCSAEGVNLFRAITPHRFCDEHADPDVGARFFALAFDSLAENARVRGIPVPERRYSYAVLVPIASLSTWVNGEGVA